MSHPKVIPLQRTIVVGDTGSDVTAVKRAMRRADLPTASAHPKTFMSWDARSIKKYQAKQGLSPTGDYNNATHKRLLKKFDSYAAYLMLQFHPNADQAMRQKIYAAAVFAYQHAPRDYNNTDSYARCEGYNERIRPPHMWHSADCSGFALWCLWLAGVSQRVCGEYTGYTGTMLEGGREVSIGAALKGDMVFYKTPVHHVAVYVGNSRVISHGEDDGPFLLPINYRDDMNQIRSYV